MMRMNEVYIRKMKEDEMWFLKMSILFGLLFTFCIYRNLSGLLFAVLVPALILFAVKFLGRAGVRVKKDSAWYFAGIVLLGVSTCLTANGFFHFFNILGILLLFMAAMVHQFYNDSEWGFAEYVKKFFILAGTCIASAGDPFKVKLRRDSAHVREQKESRRNAQAAAAGIAAALLAGGIYYFAAKPADCVFVDKGFSDYWPGETAYPDASELPDDWNGIIIGSADGGTEMYVLTGNIVWLEQVREAVSIGLGVGILVVIVTGFLGARPGNTGRKKKGMS